MRICFLILASFAAISSFAQKDSMSHRSDSVPAKTSMEILIVASVDRQVWKDYLKKAMPPVMKNAIKKDIPYGSFKVRVQFTVETDGSISEIKALDDPGYGLAEGAVSIMTSSPKWYPAIENGAKVRSRRTMVLPFDFN